MRRTRTDPSRVTKPIRVPMDSSMLAIPKPGPRPKGQPKDGRLIERGSRYSRTKECMWNAQSHRCSNENCEVLGGRYLPTPAFGHRHHPGGRGLGGGKRDDSKTELWCIECHVREHA